LGIAPPGLSGDGMPGIPGPSSLRILVVVEAPATLRLVTPTDHEHAVTVREQQAEPDHVTGTSEPL
jgi:hypothetical protein